MSEGIRYGDTYRQVLQRMDDKCRSAFLDWWSSSQQIPNKICHERWVELAVDAWEMAQGQQSGTKVAAEFKDWLIGRAPSNVVEAARAGSGWQALIAEAWRVSWEQSPRPPDEKAFEKSQFLYLIAWLKGHDVDLKPAVANPDDILRKMIIAAVREVLAVADDPRALAALRECGLVKE